MNVMSIFIVLKYKIHFLYLFNVLNFIGTGNTVIKAIAVLKEHNVLEENIILSNLFCTPPAAKTLVSVFPKVTKFYLI